MSLFSIRETLRLTRSLVTKNTPIYVQFYVTARCNLTCEQCNVIYGNADLPEVDTDACARIAENLAAIGTSVVLLTGGEPFIRKDLPAIVRRFREVGIHTRIQTNGLATRAALEACLEAGANDISISLDSVVEAVQDAQNGGHPGSWRRALAAISLVNELFPPGAFAALGCVLSPRTLAGIPDVIRFATEIGWHVSLVPAHVTPPHQPHSFRTYDPALRFPEARWPEVRAVLDEVSALRAGGANVYDSDAYLDDIYRMITGEPLAWRDRNGGVCDSPNLYFAVLPDGAMAVCCDLRLGTRVPVQDPGFPGWYRDEVYHPEIREVAAACGGCLYGSFPEITISARYWLPMLARSLFFLRPRRTVLKRASPAELVDLAAAHRTVAVAADPGALRV